MSVRFEKKKEQKNGRFSQAFYLTGFIFVVMLFNAGLLYGLWCIFDGMPWWQRDKDGIRLTILALLGASVFLAVAIVRLSGGRMLFSSTRALSDASRRVAEGDFHVRLPIPRERELGALTANFNDMVEQLGRQQMLANGFISSVSHEFRNPLSAIRGYAQLLESESITPEQRRECCAVIEEKALALSDLVTDILELSRLENSGAQPAPERFSLDEQIRQSVLGCEAAWQSKRIDLQLSLQSAVYTGQKGLLAQVWTNLIDNAVKFTPEGGRVNVMLLNARDEIVVRVEDTGVGMDAETQNRMFDKFYQGGNGFGGQGNGLGLAIVHSILDRCDASVSVDSAPGEGTTIEIRLKKGAVAAA